MEVKVWKELVRGSEKKSLTSLPKDSEQGDK